VAYDRATTPAALAQHAALHADLTTGSPAEREEKFLAYAEAEVTA
jgi:hypothetical protein